MDVKFTSPEEAAKAVKSGDRVVLSNLCSEPRLLPSLILERARELRAVRFFHCRPMGQFVERYLEPGMEEHVRCATAFAGGVPAIIELMKEGRADFYPIPLSRLPWLFRSGHYKPDVFIATVSRPDERGYCSLGISVDYGRAALETAGIVIAEVNENMPRTCGDSEVHVSKIDYMVEASAPIYELPSANVSEVGRRIGENVAELVEDGSTIQIGFGATAESIPPFLKEKKALGMHSEMFPESAMKLVEEGALNGKEKSVDRGKVVCTFSAGTRKLYEWLNNNPRIEIRPFDYTNDSRIIAQSYKMTAINTALQVDLYGNVYSDMLGFDEYSGAGGQPDFILGAMLNPEGKSIIALPSTTSNNKASRIVSFPNLARNPRSPAMPTVSRFYADYVATEWGIASLRGKTRGGRAKALIEVAHPNFKDELWKEAREMKFTT